MTYFQTFLTRVAVIFCVGVLFLFSCVTADAQVALPPRERWTTAHYDGADWHLKGEGVVCCPCVVPCPCRTNGNATFGHCEATFFLQIREGRYGAVNLNNLRLVDTSGSCAMTYRRLAALYFDSSAKSEEQSAFMQLLASFLPDETAEFPYVRTVTIDVQVTNGHFFHVSIPGILEMAVDRNWGQANPALPVVAATDYFSNALQYAENLRYQMNDEEAGLNFDYSRRQANYRVVQLDATAYPSKSMLIQFSDGRGWFNENQLRLIREQHLTLPDLDAIKQQVMHLRQLEGASHEALDGATSHFHIRSHPGKPGPARGCPDP